MVDGSKQKNLWGTLKKILLIILGTLVLLAGAGYAFLSWKGNSGPIVAEANRFQAPDNWELISERITPPAVFCGDQACNSVERAYTVPSGMRCDAIIRIFNELLSSKR